MWKFNEMSQETPHPRLYNLISVNESYVPQHILVGSDETSIKVDRWKS